MTPRLSGEVDTSATFGRQTQPGQVGALFRNEDGASAVEFGLLAPLLFFSLLSMIDIGFAIHDRIRIDHVLRAGAQPAMRDAGEAYVLDTLEATARESYNVGQFSTLNLAVDRYCVCSTTGFVDSTCTATCMVAPQRFYTLSAEKSYVGNFLPAIAFAPSVLVQVK